MKRKFTQLVRFLLVFGILAVMIPNMEAQACSCMAPPSVLEARDQSQAVFSGEVVKIEKDLNLLGDALGGDPMNPIKVTLKVHQAWKGVNSKEFMVSTADSEASCGFNFQEKSSYLVFATEYEGEYNVSYCGRTASLAAAADDVKALGAGYVPTDDGEDKQPWYVSYWPITVGVGLVLLASIFFLLFRKKQG